MTTIASLSGTTPSYAAHGHKSPGHSLLKAGQSLLAGVSGGASSLLGSAGPGGAGASAGLKAIQNAITAALQNAKQSGLPSDPDQVIKNAIKQVFSSGLSTPAQAADGLSEDSTDSSSSPSTTGGTASMPTTFQQVLQSFGVSADQFRKDLSAAIQETTGGSADASNPSQTISAGSLLNVIG